MPQLDLVSYFSQFFWLFFFFSFFYLFSIRRILPRLARGYKFRQEQQSSSNFSENPFSPSVDCKFGFSRIFLSAFFMKTKFYESFNANLGCEVYGVRTLSRSFSGIFCISPIVAYATGVGADSRPHTGFVTQAAVFYLLTWEGTPSISKPAVSEQKKPVSSKGKKSSAKRTKKRLFIYKKNLN